MSRIDSLLYELKALDSILNYVEFILKCSRSDVKQSVLCLKDERDKYKSEVDEYKTALEKKLLELDKSQEENDDLKRVIEDYVEKLSDLQDDLSQSQSEAEKLKKSSQDTGKEVATLVNKLGKVQSENENLKKLIDDHVSKMTSLYSEISANNGIIERLSSKNDELEQLIEEYIDKVSELQEKLEKSTKDSEDLSSVKKELEERVTTLVKELGKLQSDNSILTAKIASLEAENIGDTSAEQLELDSLKAELENEQGLNEEAKEALMSRIQKLTKERDNFSRDLGFVKDELQDTLEALAKERDTNNRAKEELLTEVTKITEERDLLLGELGSLRDEIEKNKEAGNLTDEYLHTLDEKAALSEEVTQLRQSNSELEDAVNRVRPELVSRVTAMVVALRQKYKGVVQERDRLSLNLEFAQEKNKKLAKVNSSLRKKLKRVRKGRPDDTPIEDVSDLIIDGQDEDDDFDDVKSIMVTITDEDLAESDDLLCSDIPDSNLDKEPELKDSPDYIIEESDVDSVEDYMDDFVGKNESGGKPVGVYALPSFKQSRRHLELRVKELSDENKRLRDEVDGLESVLNRDYRGLRRDVDKYRKKFVDECKRLRKDNERLSLENLEQKAKLERMSELEAELESANAVIMSLNAYLGVNSHEV